MRHCAGWSNIATWPQEGDETTSTRPFCCSDNSHYSHSLGQRGGWFLSPWKSQHELHLLWKVMEWWTALAAGVCYCPADRENILNLNPPQSHPTALHQHLTTTNGSSSIFVGNTHWHWKKPAKELCSIFLHRFCYSGIDFILFSLTIL